MRLVTEQYLVINQQPSSPCVIRQSAPKSQSRIKLSLIYFTKPRSNEDKWSNIPILPIFHHVNQYLKSSLSSLFGLFLNTILLRLFYTFYKENNFFRDVFFIHRMFNTKKSSVQHQKTLRSTHRSVQNKKTLLNGGVFGVELKVLTV